MNCVSKRKFDEHASSEEPECIAIKSDDSSDDDDIQVLADSGISPANSPSKKANRRETSKSKSESKFCYTEECDRKQKPDLITTSEDTAAKKTKLSAVTTDDQSASNDDNSSKNSCRVYLSKVKGLTPRDATRINRSESVSLSDILSMDASEFVESAQFNYLCDLNWLKQQYPRAHRDKALTLVHGQDNRQFAGASSSNVKLIKAKLEISYGTHHTKMMLLLYSTGMRVVVHTANLIAEDWEQKTEGLWISQMFPKCASDASANQRVRRDAGESKTKFRSYLIMYLEYYKEAALKHWIDLISQHDMSSANVFLVGSVPGRFASTNKIFGHLRLSKILADHFHTDAADETTKTTSDNLIYQFSSIGSLGANENAWLCKEFTQSLSTGNKQSKAAKPICIFPSVDNIRTSFEGYMAGGSFPYSQNVAQRQTYLEAFLQ